jgi:predicted AAA+ superfamily ATPase
MKNSHRLHYSRTLENRLAEALTDTPVVLIAGPRQAGKTTLAKNFANQLKMQYLTLDDELTLRLAKDDPIGLIRGLDRAVIDEIQRAPQLLLAIKKSVDEDRRFGRFLLTGSANLMTLPTVADSLAGRIETLTLLPLSQNEIQGSSINWIDLIFDGIIPQVNKLIIGNDLVDVVLKGGYPEVLTRTTARRRASWAQQYIDSLLQRDVQDVGSIQKLDELPRLLRALAQVSGQLCNYTQLGGQLGLDHKTIARYIGIFEQMYLFKRIPVWATNRLNRLVKTPKFQFLDSGLLSVLMDLNFEEVQRNKSRFGHVLESFVYGELLKQSLVSDKKYQFFFYRDTRQTEVDLLIEDTKGRIVGVEIKSTATVHKHDLKGLEILKNGLGDKFAMGIVLYDGDQILPQGDRIWLVPISTLWGKMSISR